MGFYFVPSMEGGGGAGVAEGSYRLVYARENVSLHERDILNAEGEPAREVKAVFAANASLNALIELLRDHEKGSLWNPAACVYRVLEDAEDRWITHLEYDLPWPLNNHDAVLKHSVQIHANMLEVHLESIDGVVPEQKGVDRMRLVRGKWTIRRMGESLVEVSYQVSSKPSPIPRLITDPIVHYHMVKSMSSLRQLLEETQL